MLKNKKRSTNHERQDGMLSKTWSRIILVAALALAAAACGQKGDLYLPGQKAAAASPTFVS